MQVRKGHTKIYQKDIVDVLDKQLLEGMGVLLTEEEQQKCEERVCIFFTFDLMKILQLCKGNLVINHFLKNVLGIY